MQSTALSTLNGSYTYSREFPLLLVSVSSAAERRTAAINCQDNRLARQIINFNPCQTRRVSRPIPRLLVTCTWLLSRSLPLSQSAMQCCAAASKQVSAATTSVVSSATREGWILSRGVTSLHNRGRHI
jgi:hypothetical protein